MTVLAALLLAALTRAQIIDRFNAAPVIKLYGMVEVHGDCDADMRRDYQLPISKFAADIMTELYRAENVRPKKFAKPALIIRLGDVRTNVTDVITKVGRRDDGEYFTRIRLPAPGYADVPKLRIETVKAFYRAIRKENLSDEEALKAYRRIDRAFAAEEKSELIRAWRENGVYADGRTDEDYLALVRGVHFPGHATATDVVTFASRLYLYPVNADAKFAGKYEKLSFRDAIAAAKLDVSVRFAAFNKAKLLPVYGGGHGERMDAAVSAYTEFLNQLARMELGEADLNSLLDAAEAKLKGVNE